MVKIASWNINSVRLRLPQVERFLAGEAPDVLCLQEIKCQAHQFPAKALAELGYVHQAVHGQKGYHGVATVSRVPFRELGRHDWQDNGEARHVGVELLGQAKGLVLENVYIPAGGDIPDRNANPKFAQKLDFIDRMTRWAERLDRATLIVGDFNIARSSATFTTTRRWSRSSATRRSRWRRSPGSSRRMAGSTSRANTSLRPVAATAGGATARTGAERTRAAGWTTCGAAPNWPPMPRLTGSSSKPANGSSLRITCRW